MIKIKGGINVNVLDKKTRKENGKLVVTKTIEEKLTLENLNQHKSQIQRQKQQIIQQSERLQEQFNNLTKQEEEIDEYVEMLNEGKNVELPKIK